MKKFSKLAALAASLVVASALAITGCSDIFSSDDGVASQGYTSADSSVVSKSLTLNVTSNSDLVDFSNASLSEIGARTIAPEAVNSSTLDFYLYAWDLIAEAEKSLTKVTFAGTNSSTTEGSITVELDASNYRFTLVAVPQGTTVSTTNPDIQAVIKKAYLIAYATADLRYTEEAASVNFVLSSDGLTGDTCSLDLLLYLKDWSESSRALQQADGTAVISVASVGLYDITTGAVDTDTLVDKEFDFSTALSDTTAKHYYGTSGNDALSTSLTAGTYDLTVTFRLANGKTFIYSEPVILLPNQKTSAKIGIPEVIDQPPEAPTNFQAGYIAPVYADSDYYKVVFNWEDNSKKELYYELDLYDITATNSITMESANVAGIWTGSGTGNTVTYANSTSNPSDSSKETVVFYGLKQESGPNWYAGSLNRNNTYAVFYIELGKRYLARIRAVNSAGNSDYATVSVAASTYAAAAVGTDTTTATNATLAHDAYCVPYATTYTVPAKQATAEKAYLTDSETETATAFNTEIINLFRVTYELSGGQFSSSLDTIYFFDQIKDGNPIMQPDSVRTITLATDIINSDKTIYNNNSAITLKYGTDSATAKKWTSWKVGSISGTSYESDYTACTTTTTYNAKETYYTEVSTGTYAVTILTDAPATSDWPNYYTGTLKPYTGSTNLVLYANYTSNTFGVTIKNVADYLIEENLGIKANLTGTSGSTPKIKTSNSDKLGSASVDMLLKGYCTPVIATKALINAAAENTYYTTAAGTTAVSWPSVNVGDTIYLKAATVATTKKDYLIIDRTQTPVTYTEKTLTAEMMNAATGVYYQAYTAYKPTDSTFWSASTTVIGTTQVYATSSGTNSSSVNQKMVTAGKGEYYYATFAAADSTWWTNATTSNYVSDDNVGTNWVKVTEGMIGVGKGTAYYLAGSDTALNATTWASVSSGTKVYTAANQSAGGTGEIEASAAMIAIGSGTTYYHATFTAADSTWWAAAVVGTSIVYSDNTADGNGGTPAAVEQVMVNAGTNAYYQSYTAYKVTDKAFWNGAVATTTPIYTYDGTDYTAVSGNATAAMISAGKDTYVTENDGTDVAVNWANITAGSTKAYLRTTSANIAAKNIVINYSYNTKDVNGVDAFGTYEKVSLEIVQQGTTKGTSVGTYTAAGGSTFTVPISNFTTGTYIATFKGYVPSSNNKQPYTYSVYLQIND